MRGIGVLIAGLILGPRASYGGLAPGETQFKAYTWFRYTAVRKGGDVQKSQFAVKRGYVRWEHKLSAAVKTRATLDIFSSDKDPHGAGLKLKDFYLELKGIVPEGKVIFGLQKTYFGLIYDWKYITIEKALEDKQKLVSSRDYGISIGGYLPQGYGEWQLEVVNGEGYKRTGKDVDANFAYVANVRVIPIPGITVGASLLRERDDRLLMAGTGRAVYRPVEVWLEFLRSRKGDAVSQGFMLMPVLSIHPKVDIVSRCDRWDKDVDKDGDSITRYIAGLNYYLVREPKGPKVMAQAFWEREKQEGKDPEDELSVQLRWEFASGKF